MGTRSITRVFNDEREVACIYRQYDGYPESHGLDVAKFLASREFVNGISGSRTAVFNGMGCFAAALVWHLKKGDRNECPAGDIYLTAYGDGDHGQEFEYEIHGGLDSDGVTVKIFTSPYDVLYEGDPAGFLAYCENPPEAEEEDEDEE